MLRVGLLILLAGGCTATHQIGEELPADGGFDAGTADGGLDGGCATDEDCPCDALCLSQQGRPPQCVQMDDENCTIDPLCVDDQAQQPGSVCAQVFRQGQACFSGACVYPGDGGACRTDEDCDCASLCVVLADGGPTCQAFLGAVCSPGCGICVQAERRAMLCGTGCLPSEDGGN